MDGNIILREKGKTTYTLENNQWRVTHKYNFINEYEIKALHQIDNQTHFFISADSKCYLRNKQKLLLLSNLTKVLGGDDFIGVKSHNQNLIIKSRNKIIIYNLTSKKITYYHVFDYALNDLQIDKRGNLWISSYNGVYFIEMNHSFSENINANTIKKRYYLDQYKISILKNATSILIEDTTNIKTIINNIGRVRKLTRLDKYIVACTNQGVFKISNRKAEQIFQEGSFDITSNSRKNSKLYYVFGKNHITIFDKNLTKQDTLKIDPINYLSSAINYKGSIFYATDDKVIRLQLSPSGLQVIKKFTLKFPRKTFSDFELKLHLNELLYLIKRGIVFWDMKIPRD